jgi:hypothetical protein
VGLTGQRSGPGRIVAWALLVNGLEVVMKPTNRTLTLSVVIAVTQLAAPASAQLALQWIVPAVAHTPGAEGTYWRSDVSLHNPHPYDLPVVLQFLPSDTDNQVADTLSVTLYPWETFNLWDVLGPEHFDLEATGAILAFADWDLACDPVEDCDFLVTSRTYTLDPGDGVGEYGQTIAGSSTWQGIDWDTLGYAAGVLNDGVNFRANVGVASWSADWTSVVVDVQDAAGTILESFTFDIPPFGHLQQRLPTPIEGGSLVIWLDDGPDDSLIFGYVSVVDQSTGDASFQLAQPSTVGFAAGKAAAASGDRRPVPAAGRELVEPTSDAIGARR